VPVQACNGIVLPLLLPFGTTPLLFTGQRPLPTPEVNRTAREADHILCSISFFPRKSCRLWDNVGKYCTAGQATVGNMAHAHRVLGN